MNQQIFQIEKKLKELGKELEGDLFYDEIYRLTHATDASVYREIPLAVARPKNKSDIKKLISFARQEKTSLIPRAAGTSLAGQVVGGGIIADISRYMTRILEINEKESWVRVEPGVVLDELNLELEEKGLFFGPETSTSNRCMMGGMVGNNACGSHSLIYGSTRDHIISIRAILSDNSEVEFGQLSKEAFSSKCQGDSLENKIYRNIRDILSDPENQAEIKKEYPDPEIKRRNTGYAIDILLDSSPFSGKDKDFNFCKLIAGSEGTLTFITEIKLNLVPLPPSEKALLCVHFESLQDSFLGNLIALKFKPDAIELMDNTILELTKDNIEQSKNRFFLKGDPESILIIEFARDTEKEIFEITASLEKELRAAGLGYYFPVIRGSDIHKIWALRKAGLGVLSNMPGDAKPVAVIEDTAINPEVLPDFMAEIQQMLDKHSLRCVYYAHIATGELHLRPVLNLKNPEHVELFHTIALETARLVKKYKGSLSGEHGDGRLRGNFIPLMIGEKNYNLLKVIKHTWDPDNIFNPGKIVNTPDMRTSLRYRPGQDTREITTYFDFSRDHGILRAAEKCNGSGDCRKSNIIGGTMCPSYMATRDENTTTRARANILREFLTNSTKNNPFNHQEIYDIMNLCLSCKGCKSECPSNIDITKYKAEFLQHYYDANGIPFRTQLIAYLPYINRMGSMLPGVFNAVVNNRLLSGFIKKLLGFAPKRPIPLLSRITLRRWAKKNLGILNEQTGHKGKVYLFADEFTQYNDAQIGIAAIQLLTKLGYCVEIPKHIESGRTFLSKGLVRKAKKIANRNVSLLKDLVTGQTPLIGIEPSGILTFRDEYPELVEDHLKEDAKALAESCLLYDEFIVREIKYGHITADQFTKEKKHIKLHGHCYQKSIASTQPTIDLLSLPENYSVEEIKSGCCGMAGSFGYEKEHYDLSMEIGELVLFPEIRKSDEKTLISAPGTSCRQQIMDGTGRKSFHPIEILYKALR